MYILFSRKAVLTTPCLFVEYVSFLRRLCAVKQMGIFLEAIPGEQDFSYGLDNCENRVIDDDK